MGANWLMREEMLLGKQAVHYLQNACVAVAGLGGVGGACCEALVRAGVGRLIVIDDDVVEETNLNRQLFATSKTLGMHKCDAASLRLLDINPALKLTAYKTFLLPQNLSLLFEEQPDVIIDAIDTVTTKLALIEQARQQCVPLISCMGTGNRFSPQDLRLGDIADTAGNGCGLCRVMRRELKKREVVCQPVCYSVEPPQKAVVASGKGGRTPCAGQHFVCTAGCGVPAGQLAVKQLLKNAPQDGSSL